RRAHAEGIPDFLDAHAGIAAFDDEVRDSGYVPGILLGTGGDQTVIRLAPHRYERLDTVEDEAALDPAIGSSDLAQARADLRLGGGGGEHFAADNGFLECPVKKTLDGFAAPPFELGEIDACEAAHDNVVHVEGQRRGSVADGQLFDGLGVG